MTKLTKSLVGEGIGEDIEFEEELLHNAPVVTHNAVVSISLKLEDNVLQVITMLAIVIQPAISSKPAANPPCTLLKVANALVIKQMCIPSSKIKTTKLWPELAEP